MPGSARTCSPAAIWRSLPQIPAYAMSTGTHPGRDSGTGTGRTATTVPPSQTSAFCSVIFCVPSSLAHCKGTVLDLNGNSRPQQRAGTQLVRGSLGPALCSVDAGVTLEADVTTEGSIRAASATHR